MDKRGIQYIEQLPLPAGERAKLLLIYSGEKPMADFEVGSENPPREQQGTFMGEPFYFRGLPYVGQLESYCAQIGLPSRRGKPWQWQLTGDVSVEKVPFIVAKDGKTLDAMVAAEKSGDHEAMGRLFGYPDTAVKAVLGKIPRFDTSNGQHNALRERPIFQDLKYRDSALSYFTEFIFSRDHVDEELRSTSARWNDTVKRLSPTIYAQLWRERS